MMRSLILICVFVKLQLSFAQAPIVSIYSNATQVCLGNNVVLTAVSNEPNSTFLWSNGSTTNSILVYPNQNTTYSCIVTANGMSSMVSQSISILSNPIADAGASFIKTCVSNSNGAYIGMTAQPGISYSWSPSTGLNANTVSNPIANPSASTTYTLIATNSLTGCSATDSVSIVVNQVYPIADAGLDGQKTCIMNISGVQLGGLPVSNQTYSWSPSLGLSAIGVANPIANPSITTNYTLTVTNSATGCSTTDQVLVSVNTAQPTASAGQDFTITCIQNTNGQTIGQNPVSGVAYNWSPSIGLSTTSMANPVANPTASTTYTLTAIELSSGCMAIDQITVNVNQLYPTVNAGVNLLKNCNQNTSGASIGTASQSGCSYSWSPSSGLSSTTSSMTFANPTQTTTYTLSATHASSGCVSTDQMTFEVNLNTPMANAGIDFITTCTQNTNGMQIGSNPIAGYSYNWFPSLGLSNPSTANPIANPPQSTSYLLTVTDQISGCVGTDQISVTVNNTIPLVDAGLDFTKTCISNVNGLTIGTTASSGLNYNWTPSIGLSAMNISNPVANPTSTTTYTLTVINTANGCTNSDMITVTVNQTVPLAQAGADFTINCYQFTSGGQIGVSPVTGNSYLWSPTAGLNTAVAANPYANPYQTTTYTLTVTNLASGCIATDQIIITVDNEAPIANAGNDFSINCFANQNGGNIGTSPQAGVTYSWLPTIGLLNSNSSSTFANPSQSTTYNLSAINSNNGCTSTDQVYIDVNLNTPIANAGPDILKNCINNTNGAQIGSIAQAQTNYTWSPNMGLSTPNTSQTWANPSQSMWYFITATNWESGCSSIDSVYFEVDIQAPIIEAGLNQNACLGDSVLLSATYPIGLQMSWNNGVQDNQYFTPPISQYYTLTVIGNNGCQSQDSLFIQVNSLPGINAGPDIDICLGQSVTLTASNGTIYNWSGGIQNGVPFIPDTTEIFTVMGIDFNGCQNMDIVAVNVHPNPIINAGIDPSICLGDSVLLAASGALNYYWSNGMLNGNFINPNFNTQLEVIGTNQYGCTGNDILNITVNQPTYSTLNVVFQGPYTLNGIIYDVSGTYIQILTNISGCDSIITLNYELIDVGVDEIELTELLIFPNPFTEHIWLKYSESQVGKTGYLINLNGETLFQFEFDTTLKMKLPLDQFPSGVYFITAPKTTPIKLIKL